MKTTLGLTLPFALSVIAPLTLVADGTVRTNPPSMCTAPTGGCGCGEASGDADSVTNACIKVSVGLGETTPWTGSLPCALKIFADDNAPSIFTEESLHATLGGYTFKRLGQKTLADGETPAEVVFSHPYGEEVRFVFPEGESWGRPDPTVHIEMDERLMMVDAEGWAATSDPVYYDLYVGDGTRRRFLATNMTGALGSLVSVTDAHGATITPEEMGVDLVYGMSGVRQFLTPSRLANVALAPERDGYDVFVYAVDAPPQKDAATGLYATPDATPLKHLSIRSRNGGKRAVVTFARNGGDAKTYVFDYVMGEWSLARESGVKEEKERQMQDKVRAQIVKAVKSKDGELLARTEMNFKWMSWGFAPTNRVEGFGGVTDTTTWTYYTSGNGKGQVKKEVRQSGLTTEYAYDASDRIISETRSGPDMMTETTVYDYTPVDASDPVLSVDTRPRTVVRKLNDIECERTYYVYSPLTNIVERVGTQGAAYGGTNVLRTVTAFYPVVANDLRSGFVQSIRHEDGKLDLYDYELSSNTWVRTVIHLHEQSPSPVSGKTTRDITITNARGEEIEARTEAYIDGIWYTIARNRMTYNAEGKRTSLENLAGQVTTTAWDCCHKVSETQPDGSTTTWNYDDDGRMIASSRLIPLDMTNVTWLTTCYEYDDLGRQVATWQTNYAAQVGLPVTWTEYDALGREIYRCVHSIRYDTTYDILGIKRTTTSGGRTIIHEDLPNGLPCNTMKSGQASEYYVYGVEANGYRRTTFIQGRNKNSARKAILTKDMFGRLVSNIQPGYSYTNISSHAFFDEYGQKIEEMRYYEDNNQSTIVKDVLFAYDLQGQLVTECEDFNHNHQIDYPSNDWIQNTEMYYFVTNNAIAKNINIYHWLKSNDGSNDLVSIESTMLCGQNDITTPRTSTWDIDGSEETTYFEVSQDKPYISTITRVDEVGGTNTIISHYGIPIQTITANCLTNSFIYDMLGRLWATMNSRDFTKYIDYNELGFIEREYSSGGDSRVYQYDENNRIARVLYSDGSMRNYAYDLAGNTISISGNVNTVEFAYNEFGEKILMRTFGSIQGVPRETKWEYDESSGLTTALVQPDGARTEYTYSADGKLVSRKWARGVLTNYEYDANDNLVRISYSDNTPSISFTYDRVGNVTTAIVANSSTNCYYYNKAGAVTNEFQNGFTMSSSYNPQGKRHYYSFADATDNTINYNYDNIGRLSHVSMCSVTNRYNYPSGSNFHNKLNRGNYSALYDRVRNDGIVGSITNLCNMQVYGEIEYEYYGNNDLYRMKHSNLSTEHPASMTKLLLYDDKSQLVNMSLICNNNQSCVENQTFHYDDNGNRTGLDIALTNSLAIVKAEYNELDQVVHYSSSNDTNVIQHYFTYDLDGNLLSDGVNNYYWNGENRLLMVDHNESNDLWQIHFDYDAFGRMIRERIIRNGEVVTVDKIWDGYNLSRQIINNGNSSIDCFYVYGLDVDNSIVDTGGIGGLLTVFINNQAYIPNIDPWGNVYQYVSIDTGRQIDIGYTPFQPSANALTFEQYRLFPLYNTMIYEPLLEAYLYQYRILSAKMGVWINRDPGSEIGLHQIPSIPETTGHQQNLYNFRGNKPHSSYDVLGFDNPGCDGVGAIPWFENHCRLVCCANHDACYYSNTCYSSSWFRLLNPFRCENECDKCNKDVVSCIWDCGLRDKPEKEGKEYFCPKRGVYIKIGDGDDCDYPSLEAAQKACTTDKKPSKRKRIRRRAIRHRR